MAVYGHHVVSDKQKQTILQNRQNHIAEGSLEVKLPTMWTDGKEEVGRVKEEKPRSEKNRKPLWREAHVQVKMYKTHQRRTTFGN